MELFIIIQNKYESIYNLFNKWLNLHASKWVVKFEKEKSIDILCILKTNYYTRIDNTIAAILNYINKNMDDTFNLKSLFKIKKLINNQYLLNEYLQKYFINLDNIETNGYKKEYLNNILNIPQKEVDEFNNKNKKNTEKKHNCIYCNKEFTTISTCNRHQKFNCDKNKNKELILKKQIKDELKNELKDEIRNEIKDELRKELSENNMKIINGNNNTINNNTTNNNTININLQTKIEKLNFYCNDTIDMDTFIKNYETNEKYQLTKEESALLLENIDNSGINSYGNGLASFLKRKYCLQFNDITGKTEEPKNCVLPFVSSDINLRSYYE